MGIKFKDLFVDYREPVNVKQLKGTTVGLDTYVLIYQMLARVRMAEQGGQEFSYQGNITSHLIGIFYRCIHLLEHDIKVTAVFDGPPPVFKERLLKERAERKKIAEEKRKEALEKEDFEAANKYAQQTISIDEQILNDTEKLFELLGIPVVHAKHDAEAQIASMTRKGILDSAVSQDYDTFAFGANHIIRNLTVAQRRTVRGQSITVMPEQYHLYKILNGLEISREQLILAGMLIGTDFNSGVKGVGPKTALKLVKKYTTLDELSAHIRSTFVKENYTWEHFFETEPEIILEYFQHPPYQEVGELRFNNLDKKGLYEFLVKDRGFSKENVTNRIKQVVKIQQQSSLSSYF